MDSQPPTSPEPAPTPSHWPPPSLGVPAPGNVPGARPASTAAPVAATAPVPVPDAAQETRAIYREGQRLLYYAVNFSRFLTTERVYGHGAIFDALLGLCLIRLHSGIERLVGAQMPLSASARSRPDDSGDANWRDLLFYLTRTGVILQADASFLADMTRRRNLLAHGEPVALDREQLIRLSQLGDTIFARLDPLYRPPAHDRLKDRLPGGAAGPRGQQRGGVDTNPVPSLPGAPPLPPSRPLTAPPPPWMVDAAGDADAPTARAAPPPPAEAVAGAEPALSPPRDHPELRTCPRCGRRVLAGDRWCPKCGMDLPADAGAAIGAPEEPSAAAPPARSRRFFDRLSGRS